LRGDERQRAVVVEHLVDQQVPAGHDIEIEAVLALIHGDDCDVALPREIDHVGKHGTI
jgi:hypothetical protein